MPETRCQALVKDSNERMAPSPDTRVLVLSGDQVPWSPRRHSASPGRSRTWQLPIHDSLHHAQDIEDVHNTIASQVRGDQRLAAERSVTIHDVLYNCIDGALGGDTSTRWKP